MSIRLDPRRVGTLKQLAADANMRPGDLVRQWVEERIDAARHGAPSPSTAATADLASRLAELSARVAALESMTAPTAAPAATAEPATTAEPVAEPAVEPSVDAEAPRPRRGPRKRVAASPSEGRVALHDEMIARVAALESMTAPTVAAPATTAEPVAEPAAEPSVDPEAPRPRRGPRKRVAASPSEGRVALHDEMIAVLSERGPMRAAELAAAVAERGRYAPPRSGKPLDAAMISQRVSNPTYRARFTRNEGRIGLAETAE